LTKPSNRWSGQLVRVAFFFELVFVKKPIMAKKLKRKAVNGNVLVEELAEERKTASGIILPDVQKGRSKTLKGKVILADVNVIAKKDDIVYFRNGIGLDVPLEDKNYLIIKATELLLVDTPT
jgi:co-chaperonin GroES (HSP10)